MKDYVCTARDYLARWLLRLAAITMDSDLLCHSEHGYYFRKNWKQPSRAHNQVNKEFSLKKWV